MICIST